MTTGTTGRVAADLYDSTRDTVPPDKQERYGALAEQAKKGRYRAAVKLKCLECCAWSYPEAKRCSIVGCSLHVINQRIFGGARQ